MSHPVAHLVLLTQTRVGFLSGGRGKRMRDLSSTEFAAQLEEAYAGATVALTRVQRLMPHHGAFGHERIAGGSYSCWLSKIWSRVVWLQS